MIKYLGSKKKLLPYILPAIRSCGRNYQSVFDCFSGTSRVGHAIKQAGMRVVSNDHNSYAATLSRCYVQADSEDWLQPAEKLINEFRNIQGRPGYFTQTFCEQSRFFQPKNGARVDAIREEIARKSLEPELESILLVSLMEAADRVDSTVGLQMAYLKEWAPRAYNDIELRLPELTKRSPFGKSESIQMDAVEAANRVNTDIVYIDPPYNQHKYLGNYHIWESLVLWDKPEVYGVACKRIDCRDRHSKFNSKPQAMTEMRRLLSAVKGDIVMSFSNEGFHAPEDIVRELSNVRETVSVIEVDYKRHVGSQIGIHNLKGEKVGEVSHTANKEFLFIAK